MLNTTPLSNSLQTGPGVGPAKPQSLFEFVVPLSRQGFIQLNTLLRRANLNSLESARFAVRVQQCKNKQSPWQDLGTYERFQGPTEGGQSIKFRGRLTASAESDELNLDYGNKDYQGSTIKIEFFDKMQYLKSLGRTQLQRLTEAEERRAEARALSTVNDQTDENSDTADLLTTTARQLPEGSLVFDENNILSTGNRAHELGRGMDYMVVREYGRSTCTLHPKIAALASADYTNEAEVIEVARIGTKSFMLRERTSTGPTNDLGIFRCFSVGPRSLLLESKELGKVIILSSDPEYGQKKVTFAGIQGKDQAFPEDKFFSLEPV